MELAPVLPLATISLYSLTNRAETGFMDLNLDSTDGQRIR